MSTLSRNIGDIIYGTTDATTPIQLTSGVDEIVRTLVVPEGTWYLQSAVNVRRTEVPVFLKKV